MKHLIEFPAYIVLDVPSPMAEWIQTMRRRFDEARGGMPAEITLTGSCGTGLITPGQDQDEVFSLLDAAAKKIKPFDAEFGNVERFNNTDIYFLTLIDDTPFFHAHEIISACGVHFEPSPYPYKPHCTLRLRKPPKNAAELQELFLLQAPKVPFRIEFLSLYSLSSPDACELIHKTELGTQTF